MVLKPEDMKIAASVAEVGKKRLDGMNGMQELEAICSC